MRFQWHALCVAVQALFNQAIVGHHWFHHVMVRSTMDCPRAAPSWQGDGSTLGDMAACTASSPIMQDWELLIYVLPSPLEGLVGVHFAQTWGGPNVGGQTGWNNNSPLVGSEVYASAVSGGTQGLADVIFHEAMHNKLRWGDNQLHNSLPSQPGGLRRSPMQPPLSQGDIALMRPKISVKRPQWLGGWRAASDPIHGLKTLIKTGARRHVRHGTLSD